MPRRKTEMTPERAERIAGRLSATSKMPGFSWSIPARRCKTGGILAKIPGSTCSFCYAKKGRYVFPTVVNAMNRRLRGLRSPHWEDAMVTMLSAERVRRRPWFRWFDSGDLQSIDHLRRICAVAARTPWVRHWLPTREAIFLRDYCAGGGVVPRNLVIRLSAPMVDGKPPKWWPLTSGVYSDEKPKGRVCPAPSQGGECRDCRVCWERSVKFVVYHRH